MQIIPQATSIKPFSVAVAILLITLSTILAVLIATGSLQRFRTRTSKRMRKTIRKYLPSLEQLPEHSRQWEQERFNKNGVQIKKEKEYSLFTYLVLLAEFCFIIIPVSEVNKAISLSSSLRKLFGSRKKARSPISQQSQRSDTTVASNHLPGNGETSTKSRANKIIQVQLAKKMDSQKGRVQVIARHMCDALFIAVRIFLFCIWIPLLLVEYVTLLPICHFVIRMSESTESAVSNAVTKREQLRHVFVAPLLFLGLKLSQSCAGDMHHKHIDLQSVSPHGLFATSHPAGSSPPSGNVTGDQSSNFGTEQQMRGAQHWKHIIFQPNFQTYQQQDDPSDLSPVLTLPHLETPTPSSQFRRRGYSDVEGAHY